MARRASHYTRWRAASLTAVYVLMGIHIAHWKLAGRTLAPLEFNEVLNTLHDGILTAGFIFMALAVLVTAVVGRFFCSWGCHILALEDLSASLLARAGIHPKPLRSRTLLWVPSLTMTYLFAWPQVERLWYGTAQPTLRVVSGTEGWTSFVTNDYWRNLPGPWIIALTFAVCGFAIVYVLGSRSFCTNVCPYGAIFGAADRLAPGRIVAVGDCSTCALAVCTAACQSQVRVHEEIARFGTIVNPSCLKDLDCVSVCPSQALRVRFTRPPLFRSWAALRGIKRPYSFSLGEDVLMAATFMTSLVVFRGLYDAIPFLLALGIAAIAAPVAVLSARLARAPHVRLNNLLLKTAGRLTARGVAFVALALVFGALLAHSGLIWYQGLLGRRAFDAVVALRARTPGDPALRTTAATALARFETVERWSLVRPPSLRRRLAALYVLTGAPAAAEHHLRAVLAERPDDREARLRLGQLLVQLGRPDAAGDELSRVAGDPSPRTRRDYELRAAAHVALAQVAAAAGRGAEAVAHAEQAVGDDPGDAEQLLAAGALLAGADRLAAAETALEEAARLQPASAAIHNNLGVVLTRLARHSEAIDHYEASLRLRPDDARVHQNLGALFYQQGDLAAAADSFEAALALDPDSVAAHVGLATVLRDRGDLARARDHWHQAGALDRRYAAHALPSGPAITRQPAP